MRVFYLLMASLFVSSCASYKENILFSAGENAGGDLQNEIWRLEGEYRIQYDDLLEIRVVNKAGESIIDPTFEPGNRPVEDPFQFNYRVNEQGTVTLPMIGRVYLKNLTLDQAAELVEEKFKDKYSDPYVKLRFLNKRAYLLGAPGGKVILLENQQTRVAEVLALGGGIDITGRSNNIRLLRGDEVVVLDFSTAAGFKDANLLIRPNDILYVEPVRRPFAESLREYNPIIGIVTAVVSVSALILSATR